MDTTTSTDGTTLAYDRVGRGPALIFVPGVSNLRDTCAPIAAQLADTFTSYTYDRRARGDSSDTGPYAVEREVEDLQAILEVAGGRATVFGYSSGGVLALRAAAERLPIDRLFLYEPPFRFDTDDASPADLPDRLQQMMDEGRTADVVSTFQLEGVGLPPEVVASIRQAPFFPQLQAMAQSVVYDAVITGTLSVPTPAMAAVRTPTVVMRGGRTWPSLATAADELVRMLPHAKLHTLADAADHGLEPISTAQAIRETTLTEQP
ncbi:alpha/beta fold hydrolase [Planctomonas deserti]|uniref:alpha/beta fold hydrolase n=1 Tax=Planctomonas deserti TaxID=2144185 RepID=UPI000D3466E4|nr:alpha/beta hydrolase [Planctomonas deserti]